MIYLSFTVLFIGSFEYLFNSLNPSEWMLSSMLILFLTIGAIFFIDIIFFGILKKVKWKVFSYPYSKIYNLLRIVTGFFLYEAVYFLFISNISRKSVFILFLFLALLILLLYADVKTYQTLPIEEIEISEELITQLPETPLYALHQVKDGESLSVIFENFNVPLNTAYKIFRLDSQDLLTKIRPGDEMRFSYMGEKLTSIEVMKDKLNSLLITISNDISIKKVKKEC